MGLISKIVSRVFGKKNKKSKGGDPSVVNLSETKESVDQGINVANQEAARNAPILFVEDEIKDSKKLLQQENSKTLEKSEDDTLGEDPVKPKETPYNFASSPALASKKPPMVPRKTKSPEKDVNDSQEVATTPAAPESTLDSNSLLDVPRTPRGGFLSGSMTPRGLSGSLTPRGLGSLTPRALTGALTPRGGSGHSFQRLD